jgi:proteasome lid subunit RPN8/RPN11
MSDRRLTITASVDTSIRRHGEETYPHECCGALIGRAGGVTDVVALPNTTEEGPRRRFLVRPSDYRLAEGRATELRGELLGFYHSHPDHPAKPSQYDLDHAWPTFAYIIVSVTGLPRRSDAVSGDGAKAGLPRRSENLSRDKAAGATEVAKAGDMTVWFLKDDRSIFEEGSLHHGENSHPDTTQTVHG